MNWPWSKPKAERRESAPFTDAVVDAIVSAANGSPVTSIAATAALEIAAGLISRIISGAVVEGPEWARRMVSSEMLRLVARDLIRRGESIHLIQSTVGSGVQLVPVGSWDVRGGWLPESWFYRCDLFGPSGNITRFVPAETIEAELTEKLEVEITLTFDEPAHADLVGRSTIAAKLAGIEGVGADRALDLAGLS